MMLTAKIAVAVGVAKTCPALCDPMDGSTPGSSALHCLLGFAQTHVRGVGAAELLVAKRNKDK